MALASERPADGYGAWFLSALLAASFLPAAVSLLNFEIFNQSVAAVTFFFSLILILSGAHVWLTLAYYADPRWLAHFRQHPTIFFAAPAAILVVNTLLVAQPWSALGLAALYGTTFVNLWHHAKQNWGIMAMVGKLRGVNVSGLRLPLVYAWPFFITAWALQLPELNQWFGQGLLFPLSLACIAAYLTMTLYLAWRDGFFHVSDPLTLAFGAVLCCYFMPLIFLYGKPYSLLIWAGAHAMQYYVMIIASLSMRDRGRKDFIGALGGSALAVAGVAGLTCLAYFSGEASRGDIWANPVARTIAGLVAGVNLVHFWVDAFIWKFSNKDIRGLHGEAFRF